MAALWVGLGCASPKTTSTTDSTITSSTTSTALADPAAPPTTPAVAPTTADTLPYDPKVTPPPAPVTSVAPVTSATTVAPAPAAGVYYANCKAAKAAGAAPLRRGQPGYRSELDGDGDGVACEK